jgi:plasmid stabilization system protein ParE
MPQFLKRPQAEEYLLNIWSHIARDKHDAADAWIDQLTNWAKVPGGWLKTRKL